MDNGQFKVSFDTVRRVPYWVYEFLNPNELRGPLSARKCNYSFEADLRLSEEFRALPGDYQSEPQLDCGHMAAAGNYKRTVHARQATYLLSNVAPQVPKLNQQYWNDIEADIRILVETAKKTHVVTGPLFRHKKNEKEKVIGMDKNKRPIHVPTHFFKVVITEEATTTKTYGLVVPNQEIEQDDDRSNYARDLSTIERMTDINFRWILPKGLKFDYDSVTSLPTYPNLIRYQR